MHFATLDAPLRHWAERFPERVALDDGVRQLTFAALHRAVVARAAYLHEINAPQHVWLDAALWDNAPSTPYDLSDASRSHDDPISRLRDFLAIVHSGRTAAVADDDWPQAIRARLAGALTDQPATTAAPDALTPFYVGFTSGSTGLPKGFRRHHRSWVESLRAAIEAFGPGAASRLFCPGRLSHSLFLFGALQGLWTGAGVVLQPRFSAARAFDTLRQGEHCVVAVPSQLAVMLDLAARRKLAPLDGVTLVMISGARWMRERTPALRALFPRARIVEFYGASETSFVAWTDADEHLPGTVVGRPFDNVEIRIAPLPAAPSDAGEAVDQSNGLIFVRSPMLFNDYVYATADGAADDTAAIRESDGMQGDWLSVRDVGALDAEGRLCLIGRAKRMLVTQGKNLFPEEVEAVLRAHPWVDDVSIHGVRDDLRGLALVAAIRWRDMPAVAHAPAVDAALSATLTTASDIAPTADAIGTSTPRDATPSPSAPMDDDAAVPPSAAALARWCRARLEPYKTPRRFFIMHEAARWPNTTSGKTDHPALARLLAQACENDAVDGMLHPL